MPLYAQLARAVLRADHGDAFVSHDAVALAVIPVVVSIEDVSNRLAGRLLDLGQDRADAPWRVRVDHHDEIAELDPARVGRLAGIRVALAGEYAWSELLHRTALADCGKFVGDKQQREQHDRKRSAFHR